MQDKSINGGRMWDDRNFIGRIKILQWHWDVLILISCVSQRTATSTRPDRRNILIVAGLS